MGSWTVILALVMAVALSLGSAAPARSSEAAEGFVQTNIDKGYMILNNTALSPDQRYMQFRDFMLGLTDIRRIALFTLGQYANGASEADLDAFVEAFTEYAVAVYEWRLSKYTGQTLRVTGSQDRAADDTVVNAEVVSASGEALAQPIRAAFRVRNGAGGKPIVTDMQVEGIWLAISQRSDFTSFLQQNNGSIPTLVMHLRMQTQQIRSGGATAN